MTPGASVGYALVEGLDDCLDLSPPLLSGKLCGYMVWGTNSFSRSILPECAKVSLYNY